MARPPDLIALYPHLRTEEEPAYEPSCSLMVCLSQQDPMISAVIASLGTEMLYCLFREGESATRAYSPTFRN